MHVAGLTAGCRGDHGSGCPRGIVEIGRLPSPRIGGGVHTVAGTRGPIPADGAAGDDDGSVGFIAGALPRGAGIGNAFGVAVALQDEGGLEGDLGFRRMLAEVPHHGGEQVFPGLQEACDVDGFVAPMEEVSAGRSPRGALAVDEQLIPVVTAGVHEEALGPGGQVEGLAEVVDAVFGLGRFGDGDPFRGPFAPQEGLAA